MNLLSRSPITNPRGQAILEPGVTELVDRADCTQDIALACILQEAHEAYGCPLVSGKLNEGEARRPSHRIHEAGCRSERDADCKPGCQPCGETKCGAAQETDHKPEGSTERKPDSQAARAAERPDGRTR